MMGSILNSLEPGRDLYSYIDGDKLIERGLGDYEIVVEYYEAR